AGLPHRPGGRHAATDAAGRGGVGRAGARAGLTGGARMARAGSPATDRRMTVAEFLDFDDGTDTRYELVEGQPVAMNPPKVRHVALATNLTGMLFARLEPPCRPYIGGGVALSDEHDEYRLPDIFVSCAELKESYFD